MLGWENEEDRVGIVAAVDEWRVQYRDVAARFCAEMAKAYQPGSDVALVFELSLNGREAIACAAAWERLERFVDLVKGAETAAAAAAICRSQVRQIDFEIRVKATRPNVSLLEAAVRMAVIDGMGRARDAFEDIRYRTRVPGRG